MAISFKRQQASNVLTPEVGNVVLFVDRNGFPSLKDSNGLVTLLVSSVSGPAGGDLTGAYPNPSVVSTPALKTSAGIVTVSGSIAPSSGQVLVATGPTGATWQSLPATPPTGAASGDLASTYPNPIALRTAGIKTSTTTVSTAAASPPSTGQVLTATSSTTATWQSPPAITPSGPAGGNLSGSYPNPTVDASAAIKSATTNVSSLGAAAPSSGQMLISTGSTVASWQSPSFDLGSVWTNPTVVQARGLKSASTTVSVSSSAAPTTGQVLKASSSTSAAWSRIDTYVRNEIMDPPLSPDSADEEFTTDPFFGGSGKVYALAFDNSVSLITRAGNVTPWTQPGLGTYASTLAGSSVFLQAPSGQYYFLKQVPSPTSGDQLWLGALGAVAGLSPEANGPSFGLVIAADTAGVPNMNNRVEFLYSNNDSTGVTNDLLTFVVSGGTATTGPVFNSNAMGVTGLGGFAIRKGASQFSGSSNSITFGFFGPNGELSVPNGSLTSFSGNWAWAGFRTGRDASRLGPDSQWADIFCVHFLRRKLSSSAYIFG